MHRPRHDVPRPLPVHVTLRVRPGIPSLRNPRLVATFRASLRASLARASARDDLRVVHYALLSNHAHLIVESDDAAALSAGMKSVGARLARAVNRTFGHRGAVLDGRFHSRVLATPREVRNALRYVLLNARRHGCEEADTGREAGERALTPDFASSGRWFDGWREGMGASSSEDARLNGQRRDGADERAEVARPQTWLLRVGWRRHGLISLREVPGAEADGVGAG